LLLEISQKAMDLNMDGLMIETHPDPDQAWSDAEQQVTAEGLQFLLSKLVLRSRDIGAEIADQMLVMREKIGILDDRLFDILSARMHLSEEVGLFKKENNITILQPEHWAKSIQQRMHTSCDLKLSEGFIRQVMDAIHQESIRHQTNIMNRNEEND
jgi:chorismate mutase